jgi:DNA invertase Pin-like site-specific DNA recombinase
VRVDRGQIPEAAQRERLNQLLLAHDPEVAERNRARITDRDFELLRRIAQEGALAGTPPVLRRNAITYLADRPTPENLNLLVDLARHGEDLYVRGAALAALGRTGLGAVAPILVDGLAAREPVEAAAAEHGIVALGRVIGVSGLRAAFAGERRKAVLERLDRALARIADAGKPPRRRPKPRPTATDKSKRKE